METPLLETNKVEQKLKYWVAQLRDMGRRNKLLFFKETKTSTAIFTEPDPLEVFERVVVQGKPIYAPLQVEEEEHTLFNELEEEEQPKEEEYQRQADEFLANKPLDRLNRVLGNLRYKARTLREEQGFNALFLAFGLLRWREGISGEYSEAPLILVPIDIVREEFGARLRLEMLEEEIVVNPTLQTKLSKDYSIELEDAPNEMGTEELQAYWNRVNDQIRNLEGWNVQAKVIVGIFNFQTLMIINDLELNARSFIKHPLIQMLSGYLENLLAEPDDVPTAEELDDKVNPMEVFQILDADSSQQEAIEAAKHGVSFVLQGPPGTGKSQTIANIIAESLAAGKKILFVSQKSVALDVVYKRLASCGLGEFCLEVHSYKKNKKDVINDLGKSLNAQKHYTPPDTTSARRELLQTRDELNRYVKELHKPRLGIQMSLYRVLGELSMVYDSPNLKFSIESLDDFTAEQQHTHISIVRELVSYSSLIENYVSHPWKGFQRKSVSIQDREEITDKFQEVSRTLTTLCINLQEVAKQHRLVVPETIQQLFDHLRVIEAYKPDVLTDEYADCIDRFLTEYDSFARFIKLSYWKDLATLSKVHWKEEKLPLKEIKQIARVLKAVREEAIAAGLTPQGGTTFTEEDTNTWQESKRVLEELYDFTISLFDEDDLPEVLETKYEAEVEQAASWFEAKTAKVDQITEWVNFNKVLTEAEGDGLGSFIEHALENQVPPSQWERAYNRRLYVLLSDAIIQSDATLAKFRSSSHNSIIDRFRNLDNELREAAGLEIRAKLQLLRPKATWVQADSAETTILRKELNKKRRIKPLRRLFAEIPNLILTLRPCLMMSPLTVSQLLDPEIYHFDIAIFDEASQIPPEYAVGTIMRANQVVIAGDRHQLPPTRFFHTIDTDEYDADDYDIEEYESILNACDAINMPNRMLLWHYRSEDESLITFSNYNFYDNKLLTFPNANGNDSSTGLQFIYVQDGIYKRGHGARNNVIEARRVADLVLEHLQETPNLSLGIVAFSQSQRHIIEMELDREKKANPQLYSLFDYNKDEEIFTKNLETVQGDERDVIIFSVGYGKDELGKMSMNFGPLNRQGGERRLNVAVTRARRAVKLVASIEPEDIDLSRTKSQGARLLRSYMKVARDGPDAIFEDLSVSAEAEFDSPFEEAVYDALKKRNIQLRKQVGVSQYRIDLGVVDPEQSGQYLLGIECDGRAYHSSPTARDRDRLRQQLLEDRFGWRIHRIWSRDWIDNPQREIDKVLKAIEESKKLGPKQPVKKN